MENDGDLPQYIRAHLAKRGMGRGGLDGGSIAVGLIPALVGFAVPFLLVLPPVVALAIVGIGLFFGGYVAGRMVTPETACVSCHGALVGIGFLVIAAVVALAESIAADGAFVILLDTTGPMIDALAVLATPVVATLGAVRGRNQ